MRVSIHITTHCRSTHLQHVVAPQMGISQLLYLKVTFNICYSSRLGWRGMLISLVSRAELWLLVAALQVFILAFVRQHMGRGWNSGLWSLFKSISYLFSLSWVELLICSVERALCPRMTLKKTKKKQKYVYAGDCKLAKKKKVLRLLKHGGEH